MNLLTRGITDITELFFPALCVACGNRLITQEKYLCMPCWHDIPATNIHLNPIKNPPPKEIPKVSPIKIMLATFSDIPK